MNPADSLSILAASPSVASFSLSLGDGPLYDLLLWGVNEPLPTEQIELLGTSLQIVPEPSALLLGVIAALTLLGFRRAGAKSSAENF